VGLQELQDSFRFTQYLLIASAYRDPQTSAAEPEQKPAKPSKKKPKVRTCFSELHRIRTSLPCMQSRRGMLRAVHCPNVTCTNCNMNLSYHVHISAHVF